MIDNSLSLPITVLTGPICRGNGGGPWKTVWPTVHQLTGYICEDLLKHVGSVFSFPNINLNLFDGGE